MSIRTWNLVVLFSLLMPRYALASECQLDRFDAIRVASSAIGIEQPDTAVFRVVGEGMVWVVFVSDGRPGRDEWVLEVACDTGTILRMTAGVSQAKLRDEFAAPSEVPEVQEQTEKDPCPRNGELEPID